MAILSNEDTEVKWIGPNGRVIVLQVGAVRCDEVPGWLAALVLTRAQRFDYGLTLGPLEALRLWGLPGWDRWGRVEGPEWFVSEAIPREEQGAVAEVARVLKIDMAFSIDLHYHVLAPKGTLR